MWLNQCAPQSSITPLKSDSCKEALSFQILAAIRGTQANETKTLLHRDVLKKIFARERNRSTHSTRHPPSKICSSPQNFACFWRVELRPIRSEPDAPDPLFPAFKECQKSPFSCEPLLSLELRASSEGGVHSLTGFWCNQSRLEGAGLKPTSGR